MNDSNQADAGAQPSGRSRRSSYQRYGARYRARRRAVEILFEAELRDVDPVAIAEDRVQLACDPHQQIAPVSEYTQTIVTGVAEGLDRIDDLIAGHLRDDWQLERIQAVDRAILRVAVWELIANPEVPPPAAIQDAVELASRFSTDDAPKYINALLDELCKGLDVVRDAQAATASEAPGASEDDAPAPAASPQEPSEAQAGAPAMGFVPIATLPVAKASLEQAASESS